MKTEYGISVVIFIFNQNNLYKHCFLFKVCNAIQLILIVGKKKVSLPGFSFFFSNKNNTHHTKKKNENPDRNLVISSYLHFTVYIQKMIKILSKN